MDAPTNTLPTPHGRPLASWSNWKQLWREATHYEQHLGLILCGFDVPAQDDNESAERICIYLDLADGGELNRVQTGESEEVQGNRRALARQAYQVLAENFFKNHHERQWPPSWMEWVCRLEVLEKVLWFFRLSKHRPYFPHPIALRNLSFEPTRHEYLELARTFLVELWNCTWRTEEYDAEVKNPLEPRRPELIELLCGIGRLALLDDRSQIWGLDWFDDHCEKKLRELALRQISFPRWHPQTGRLCHPRSVEEAAAFGSEPARMLTLLYAMRQQYQQHMTAAGRPAL